MHGNLRRIRRRGIASVPDLLSEGYPDICHNGKESGPDRESRNFRDVRSLAGTPTFSRSRQRSGPTGEVLSGRDRIIQMMAFPFPMGERIREVVHRGSSGHGSRNCFGLQSKEIREKYQGIPGRFFWFSIEEALRMDLSFRRYVVSDKPESLRPLAGSPPDFLSRSTK